jgi:hypothetical protein
MSELLDLNCDVFVTPSIPTVTSDLPPGTTQQRRSERLHRAEALQHWVMRPATRQPSTSPI